MAADTGDRPRVDVVVLTWNDNDLAAIAVQSALASTGVDVNVIVVDNGSEPPARFDHDEVRVLRNDVNRGVAGGRNRGAREGDAPLVCLLDSDAALHPDTIEQLTRPLAADPRIALAAPVFEGQEPSASAGLAPSLWRKASRVLGRTAEYERVATDGPWWDVDFAIGACQLFRREAYDAVGGLDEGYFYGPEDVDFCLRLIRSGRRVVQVRDASCIHPARRLYRRPLSVRGLYHAWAVVRHLARHRGFRRRYPLATRGA
ncbi:MAG TPA: glycosyltransferase [Acidimicrobiales bacterium]